MKSVRTILFLCTLLFGISKAENSTTSDEFFPTPEILKDRVAFWKKIYSEFTLNDGVIHDRDYPAITYKKVYGNVNTSNIKKLKENIFTSLNIINTQPESAWSKEEIEIAERFRQNGIFDKIKDAAERVRFQQGQADRFREGLIRSGLYLDTIRSILRQHGVPERLAYLPHVESSFNTAAYSKVGAAGLWQFMRGTGILFGMKINYSIDERKDPIIATRGAAKYLASAYSVLQAWPLAITSYNHGINGMKRAVNATGSRDLGYIIQNYESNSFKFASSNFYSCFLAASEIAENYKNYFPNLSLHPKLQFSDYTLSHYVRPDILCKYLNVTLDQLITLNPSIRSAVFEQKNKLPAGFTIHIPSTITPATIQAAIASIPDSLKSNKPDHIQYYKVNKGDRLISIATRLGVSVQDLARENKIGRKSRLIKGQLLRVPPEKPAKTPVVAAVTNQKATEKYFDSSAKETVQPVVSNTDTMKEIAQNETQQKLPPEEIQPAVKKPEIAIANANQKSKDVAPVKIPEPSATKEPVISTSIATIADSLKEVATTPAVESKEPKQNERPSLQGNIDISIYNLDLTPSPSGSTTELTVSIDETIGHYANWLGIPTSRIRKLNNMGRGSDIRINKRLLIPVNQKDILDQFIEARLEYHMAIEEDFYAQYKVSEVKPHVIQKRENLWDIFNSSENENAIPLWLFKKYNKQLDINRLAPGTTVWIPVIADKNQKDLGSEDMKSGYSSSLNQTIKTESKVAKKMP